MKIVKLLLIISAAICCSCVENKSALEQFEPVGDELIVPSATRSLEEAKAWALKSISFIETEDTKAEDARSIESWNMLTLPNTKSDGDGVDTLIYVFNFADSLGFSIIAANQSVSPILAVTESGHYVAGEPTGNDSFDFFMDGVKERLVTRLDGTELYYWYDYVTEGETINKNVGVRWGQEDIYATYCPNGHCGCVATAMGQIMAYHQEPSSFTTTVAMSSDYAIGATVSLPWTSIRSHQVNHTNTQNCSPYHNNIAALLREIGAQVNMVYGSLGSSAYDSAVPDAFDYFGLEASDPISFSVSSAKNYIKQYGPVYMGGTCYFTPTTTFGHAWVLDGYKDYTYSYCKFENAGIGNTPIITQQTIISEEHSFHINWGFDGDCNGYFDFGVFDVDGANTYDYSHYITDVNFTNYLTLIRVY